MNQPELDLNWIISEVIRRLNRHNLVVKNDEGTREFQGKLVTLDRLTSHWDNCQRLVVDRSAVVTPAVRDELVRRGIELTFRSTCKETANPRAVSSQRRPFCVAVARESGPQARFIDLVQHLDREVEQEAVPRIETAVQKATAAVQQQRKSVIWTAVPTEAVCLANRQSDIWAVQGWDLNATAQAMRHTQANLLVVDRNQHNPYMQRAIINSFLSGAG